MTEYLRARFGGNRSGATGHRGGVGGSSEETLPSGGARATGRAADKAVIQPVEVQPRQLPVADADSRGYYSLWRKQSASLGWSHRCLTGTGEPIRLPVC
jgi:hypothetical protein